MEQEQQDGAAKTIANAFRTYRTAFEDITQGAQRRFENEDWQAIGEASAARLALYKQHMMPTAAAVATLDPSSDDWVTIKGEYHARTRDFPDAELAETFYNSIYREVTNDAPVDNQEMFVTSMLDISDAGNRPSVVRRFTPEFGIVTMVSDILTSFDFSLPWRDLDADVGNILRSLAEERPEIRRAKELSVEILTEVFYRNKGAYLIGKICYETQTWPVALPVLNDRGALYIDTLICDEDEMSVMFSFTRAYFMVRAEHPSAIVAFLSDILPNKKTSETYTSLGFHKHGKTEFYRGFLSHLDASTDKFVIAPGIKGMVMSVFMLDSYQTVFKVIKDRFPPQKNTSAAEIKEKYGIVKAHDRVGRMADTQEFQNFAFPRDRFDDELIEELLAVANESVTVTDTTIVIKHLYTERLMRPLNLFIEEASEDDLRDALDEYGNAIKQLAGANIFPGDMLLKNFGITRHGRVVFYDYDEISYLSEVNFREIPEPQTPEQEMASEPWYSVAANDVFPEEFRRFLFGRPNIKRLFANMHGELFDAVYWQRLQDALSEGEVGDVFPYRRKKRFARARHRTRPKPNLLLEQ